MITKTSTRKVRDTIKAKPKAGKVTNDRPNIPVGGRLFSFRAAWKGAHFESVIKKGLSWS